MNEQFVAQASDVQTIWQQLVQQGILGTERQPTTPPLPTALATINTAPVDNASLTENALEQTFLQNVSLLTHYRTAAQRPQSLSPQSLSSRSLTGSPSIALIEPVADTMSTQPTPANTDQRSALLRQINREFDAKLVVEWLHHAAIHGQTLPIDQLPSLLDRAQQDKKIAAALTPCLGPRGRWLLALNPAWQIDATIELSEESWQHGPLEKRTAYLSATRATDPATARTKIEAVWGSEAAADRATMLATLENNLSAADLPFLESALQDRSRQVRTVATRLLLTLPHTPLRQTILAQLTNYLRIERKWLKRQLTVHLPNQFAEEWQAWGLREQSPLAVRIGQKAGWLVQLIALVPPSALVEALGVDALELLELIRANDYAEALMTALLEGAEAHNDYRFLLTELRHLLRLLELAQVQPLEFIERFARYAPILPEAERLILLQQYLAVTRQGAFGNWATLQQLVRTVDQLPLSMTSELLTKQMPALLRRNTGDYGVGRILVDLAYKLDPGGYAQADTLFQRRQGEEQPEYIGHFLQIYRLRQRMAQAFAT